MDKKYWHEIPQEEVDKLIADKTTMEDIIKMYKQPDWCTESFAFHYFGCWSLMDNQPGGLRTKISHEFCSDCECYKK